MTEPAIGTTPENAIVFPRIRCPDCDAIKPKTLRSQFFPEDQLSIQYRQCKDCGRKFWVVLE